MGFWAARSYKIGMALPTLTELFTGLTAVTGRVTTLETVTGQQKDKDDAQSAALAAIALRVATLERAGTTPATMPVRQTDLLTLLGILADRYQLEIGASSGEGSTIGPRMRGELVARAKRELVRDLVAELGKLA